MPDAFGAVEVRPNIDIDPHIAADVRHLKKENESMATSCAFHAEDYCHLQHFPALSELDFPDLLHLRTLKGPTRVIRLGRLLYLALLFAG